jgi:superfamily I DNA/RNA helicase
MAWSGAPETVNVKHIRHFSGDSTPSDSIKEMTLHVSKGLEFPVVGLAGAGRMPAESEDEREEARLFYVGAAQLFFSYCLLIC